MKTVVGSNRSAFRFASGGIILLIALAFFNVSPVVAFVPRRWESLADQQLVTFVDPECEDCHRWLKSHLVKGKRTSFCIRWRLTSSGSERKLRVATAVEAVEARSPVKASAFLLELTHCEGAIGREELFYCAKRSGVGDIVNSVVDRVPERQLEDISEDGKLCDNLMIGEVPAIFQIINANGAWELSAAKSSNSIDRKAGSKESGQGEHYG